MIERETVDRVVIVRLAHGSVNAIDIELAAAIRDTFTALAEGPHVGVVLTGTGGAFSAGVDLRRLVSEGADYARSFVAVLVEAFEAVFNVEKPVVAAVNGHAIAGGCVLVCACDRRLMADGPGRIGVTELLAGVPFPRVALEILKFAVGASRATGLVLKGTTCEPADALAAGLIDEVVPADALLGRAVSEVTWLAERIPTATFRLSKRQLHEEANANAWRTKDREEHEVTELWAASETFAWIDAYMSGIKALRSQRRPPEASRPSNASA